MPAVGVVVRLRLAFHRSGCNSTKVLAPGNASIKATCYESDYYFGIAEAHLSSSLCETELAFLPLHFLMLNVDNDLQRQGR